MATYSNDLRLKEIATGGESGTWGTSTNTNLALIADAFGYGTKQMAADTNETFTMPDGTADGTRAMYLKITSAVSLSNTRTVTLGPNTVSKVWIIENATTGSQSITISQGSGGTVTIANGAKAMVYTDGAGAGAAVVSANPTVVTSVAQSFTGGLISVSGSPITTSGTLALTVTGTSGGIPYFSSASTWASSGALTANALVIGGGAGAAPSTTTTGTGILTFLGTPSSANLAAAVTDETGSGALVFANTPTLATPRLAGSSTGYTTFASANSSASNYTVTFPAETMTVGFRNVPAVGTKTGSYTLEVGDVGKYVQVGSGGSITIPNSTFAEGDVVSVFNNTSGNVTITCSITTAYIAGLDSDKATMTLATRGVATILFISGTVCVVSGNVS